MPDPHAVQSEVSYPALQIAHARDAVEAETPRFVFVLPVGHDVQELSAVAPAVLLFIHFPIAQGIQAAALKLPKFALYLPEVQSTQLLDPVWSCHVPWGH